MALAWHITVRLRSSRVIATSDSELAWVAGCVRRVDRSDSLLGWSLAHTHGHAVNLGGRREPGQLARRLQIGLQQHLGRGDRFEPARLQPVNDQRHLGNASWYLLRQAQHHGIQQDPWHVASSLPELLGLRIGGAPMAERVPRHLPRVDAQSLADLLGWSGGTQRLDQVGPDGLPCLADAAAAAAGLAQLRGRSEQAVRARLAAVILGLEHAAPARITESLGVGRSTVFRLREQTCAPELPEAVRRQWAWRLEVADRASAGMRESA